jgi:RNA polymerase II subunit A small phosphatase-like protein
MKTLVLDLDETLVHSSFKPFDGKPDMTLRINFDRRVNDIYVLVRPGVKEFLESMARHYELVLFTASLSEVTLCNLVCRSFDG